MSNKHGSLTAAEIEARRRNSLKSTGPRTARGKRRACLNALKRGVSTQAQAFHATMCELEEDPEGFMRLLRGLIAARQPADAVEMMLIEDIAVLEWKKMRLDRAQAGKQAQTLHEFIAGRRHRALQVGRDTPDISQAEVFETGIRHLVNSPAKFGRLMECLELLLKCVKENDASAEAELMLSSLYGERPSLRGAEIINLFRRFTHPAEQTAEQTPAGKLLELAIQEEIRDVMEEYVLYLEEHIEVSRAQRDAALAPTPYDWYVMIRQENALNHMIERKLILLERIQSARRKREAGGSACPSHHRSGTLNSNTRRMKGARPEGIIETP
jgi:hypothetical protein